MPIFHQSQYEVICDTIREMKCSENLKWKLAHAFADRLQADNSRFNRGLFLEKAVSPEQEP